jgi:hypothetical protein
MDPTTAAVNPAAAAVVKLSGDKIPRILPPIAAT